MLIHAVFNGRNRQSDVWHHVELLFEQQITTWQVFFLSAGPPLTFNVFPSTKERLTPQEEEDFYLHPPVAFILSDAEGGSDLKSDN